MMPYNASADDRPFTSHNIPLLSRRDDEQRFSIHVDDPERADGNVTERSSRQSSFDFTDRPVEQISSGQGSTWTAILHEYAPWLARSMDRRKMRSDYTNTGRSRPLRACLYFIAVTLMILSVSLQASSSSHTHSTTDPLSGVLCSPFRCSFSH